MASQKPIGPRVASETRASGPGQTGSSGGSSATRRAETRRGARPRPRRPGRPLRSSTTRRSPGGSAAARSGLIRSASRRPATADPRPSPARRSSSAGRAAGPTLLEPSTLGLLAARRRVGRRDAPTGRQQVGRVRRPGPQRVAPARAGQAIRAPGRHPQAVIKSGESRRRRCSKARQKEEGMAAAPGEAKIRTGPRAALSQSAFPVLFTPAPASLFTPDSTPRPAAPGP